ncbi:hypothetical protein FQN54_001161 [Arachnomyces sp. PD_36]|nr:hypothetical protein FQN54_001161 [Arachnomyces sp. PD_36]
MSSTSPQPLQGGCTCGHIRYKLTSAPLFVHCCHCTTCQTETGTGFALNAIIETSATVLLSGTPTAIATPSESGMGQLISRCPQCHVAVWSNYGGAGPFMNFIRVGTLDPEARRGILPDVHIYTKSKLPWVVIPEGAKKFEEFYDAKEQWPEESLSKMAAIMPEIKQWKSEGGNFSPEKA